VYDDISMEKDNYGNAWSAETDISCYINTIDELSALVREVYLACPDEPFINQYGNKESWNLYLVSDLVLENLSFDAQQNVFNNLISTADDYHLQFDPFERTGSIKNIVGQLLTEAVVKILRDETSIDIADQKRILLAEDIN